MPSKLALLLCLLFCAVVYWRESRRGEDVSWALWVPTLWLMRCGSRSLCAWFRGGSTGEFEAGCIYDRIFLFALIVVGLYILSKRSIDWLKIGKSNLWLFVLFAYMGISCLWADYPGVSFKRWVRGVGDLIMVLIVLKEEKPIKAIGELFRNCFILLIPLSIVFSKYFPDIGRGHAKHWLADSWIGVATHKNTLGALALVAGIYFFWEIIRKWPQKEVIGGLYLLMVIYLLNGNGQSRSATSIVLLVLGSVIMLAMSRWRSDEIVRKSRLLGVIIVCLFCFLIASSFTSGSSILSSMAVWFGRDPTLSGRSELWVDLIQMGMERPLFGAGYSGFWTPSITALLSETYKWNPGEAHNGYIEVFINLGIVGLLLIIFVVASALRGAMKEAGNRFELGRLRITLLFVALLHNYTEASFTRPTHIMWFIFLLIALNIFGEGVLKGRKT